MTDFKNDMGSVSIYLKFSGNLPFSYQYILGPPPITVGNAMQVVAVILIGRSMSARDHLLRTCKIVAW